MPLRYAVPCLPDLWYTGSNDVRPGTQCTQEAFAIMDKKHYTHARRFWESASGVHRKSASVMGLLLLGILAVLCVNAWAGPAVLLLWDDDPGTTAPDDLNPNTLALIAAMEAAGFEVTLSNTTQGGYSGSNPAPYDFDVVVHLNANSDIMDSVMPDSGVNILVDYVENGAGTYIGSENNGTQLSIPMGQGLNPAMEDLTLIERTAGIGTESITLTTVPAQSSHPVVSGVPSPFTFSACHLEGTVRGYATDPATVLMTDGSGNDAVAVRDFGSGRAVFFHHAGNANGASTLSNANMQQLYINAAWWGDQKPPSVLSLSPADPNPSAGGTLNFALLLREGVTGLDASDFMIDTTGDITSGATVAVSAVSDREYQLAVANVAGEGTLRLKLEDDDSIVDMSMSQNPLGGVGDNGDFIGDEYTVDSVAPELSSFDVEPGSISDPLGHTPQLGDTPQFTLVFNEPMNQSVYPEVTLTSLENGDITASSVGSGGDGDWVNGTTYQVSLDRAVEAADEGMASVTVSGAQDALGNAMAPDTSNEIPLISGGLRFVSQPLAVVWAEVDQPFSFVVEVENVTGDVHYQWYKQAAKAFVPVGDDAAILSFDALEYTDSGAYYCEVTDDTTQIESNLFILAAVDELPAAGLLGLGVLAGILALSAAVAARRR